MKFTALLALALFSYTSVASEVLSADKIAQMLNGVKLKGHATTEIFKKPLEINADFSKGNELKYKADIDYSSIEIDPGVRIWRNPLFSYLIKPKIVEGNKVEKELGIPRELKIVNVDKNGAHGLVRIPTKDDEGSVVYSEREFENLIVTQDSEGKIKLSFDLVLEILKSEFVLNYELEEVK